MDLTIDRLTRFTFARLPGPPGRAWRDAELARLRGFVDDIMGRVSEDTERLELLRRHRRRLTSGVTCDLSDSIEGLRALLKALPARPELITSAVAQTARIQSLIDNMGALAAVRPGDGHLAAHRDVPRCPR
ncbi:hypothetical protein GCM10009677_33150 [Sphaerisporangium rubeum]